MRPGWGSAKFVVSVSFENLHNMVAAFVPLELLRGLRDFCGHDDRRGLEVDEIVVARLGLQSLGVGGEVGGGEDLELICRGHCGSCGKERFIREDETGGDWRGTKEVAAGRILDHGESQTHLRSFCQLRRLVAVH